MIRFGSYLQTHWDWRAAGNFMFGGTGSALLVTLALVQKGRPPELPVGLVALALVGLGLFLVWLEIGRPWRALHVFFHPQASWMSREAAVATVLFPLTLAALWFGQAPLFIAAAVLGAVFLYCQGRILHASRGIPAWREDAIVALVVATGLTEGIALALLLFGLFGGPAGELGQALVVMIVLRSAAFWSWRRAVTRAGAPAAALTRIGAMTLPFLLLGNAVPAALALAAAFSANMSVLQAAAALALAGGWHLKFVIVTGAAQVQGYGIGKLQKGRPVLRKPVRRDGDPWRA